MKDRMLRFSFANYIANIFWISPNLALPIIVLNLLGAEQNAYFSVRSILPKPPKSWILAASAFPVSLNYVYFTIRRVEKKIRSVILLTGFTAAITLGLTYALIPIMFVVADNQRCGYTHLSA
jgi:hypothetical protein